MNKAKNLYNKLWDAHVVHNNEDGTSLLYIDRHLVHEVTSPQAFEGLKIAQRKPHRKGSVLAVPDHNVPTTDRNKPITDPASKMQLEKLDENCSFFDINQFDLGDLRQGVVHVIGPEQGATIPGMTVVCGDSHTSTHGAFGALAFGIGTSEVEHVLATQCLVMKKSQSMLIKVTGELGKGVTAKDLILTVIGKIGTAGGTGYVIEFQGKPITELSMEGRMTVCNMAIEAGARSGIIAVDPKTIEYVAGRPFAPAEEFMDQAQDAWKELHSDPDAHFDKVVIVHGSAIEPQVSWGTSPEMVVSVVGEVPDPDEEPDEVRADAMRKALCYMGLSPKTPMIDIQLDRIFIGSCTNGRIEDLRATSEIVKGQRIANTIKQAIVVPGSGLVKEEAEQEGLDQIFIEAGFEWREPGCSMCLAMNDDRLDPGERCASTSNRNFEGRQGAGGRTHLVSPVMAAAAAVAGHFVDVRDLVNNEIQRG